MVAGCTEQIHAFRSAYLIVAGTMANLPAVIFELFVHDRRPDVRLNQFKLIRIFCTIKKLRIKDQHKQETTPRPPQKKDDG